MDKSAAPFLSKLNLFEVRTEGYWNYRIPGIVVTRRGVVLVTTEARQGRGGDWDNIDVLMRRSTDGGLTWEPPRVLVSHEPYGEGPTNNCVLIRDEVTGAVHALYGHNYARVFTMRSDDDGLTFSPPREITATLDVFRTRQDGHAYPWRVVACGPGHGLQLRNGRLIAPLWMSTGEGEEFGSGKLGHRPSVSSLIYSDDHGESWHCGELVARTTDTLRYPSETAAVELSDGRVLFNMRTESDPHRRLVSISPDGVSAWSEPAFDDALLEPQCMASMIRYSWQEEGQRGRILFANPDNLERTLPGGWSRAYDRKRLTVKMSYDECRTWPISKVLEEGGSAYSDLAVGDDATILCLYECGYLTRMSDTRYLTLARFNLAWLTDGRDLGVVMCAEAPPTGDAKENHSW